MKTLEQILEKEKQVRVEGGMFGINACKESIQAEIQRHQEWNKNYSGKEKWNTSLYVLLEQFVKRTNEEVFFNSAMVLACWELINNR